MQNAVYTVYVPTRAPPPPPPNACLHATKVNAEVNAESNPILYHEMYPSFHPKTLTTPPPPLTCLHQLWWYGDLSPNAAERRGSTTMTYDPRRSSLTESQSLGDILRRTSSASAPGLDFSRIGKVAPITEDPSELTVGRRRPETAATSPVPPR